MKLMVALTQIPNQHHHHLFEFVLGMAAGGSWFAAYAGIVQKGIGLAIAAVTLALLIVRLWLAILELTERRQGKK